MKQMLLCLLSAVSQIISRISLTVDQNLAFFICFRFRVSMNEEDNGWSNKVTVRNIQSFFSTSALVLNETKYNPKLYWSYCLFWKNEFQGFLRLQLNLQIELEIHEKQELFETCSKFEDSEKVDVHAKLIKMLPPLWGPCCYLQPSCRLGLCLY